jgi:hypothetical protein
MKILGPLISLLVLLGLVLWRGEPTRITEEPIPRWKHSLKQAEILRHQGDLDGASDFYARAAQMAASVDDWKGLLAVACGLQRLGDSLERPMNSHAILLRAMMAAQRKQSAEGLQAVAVAFKSSGEWFASLALSRIQATWRHGGLTARDLKLGTCWPGTGRN